VEMQGTRGTLPASSTKKGKKGVLKVLGLELEEGQLFSYSVFHPKLTNKVVSSHFEAPLVLGQATSNTRLT